MFASAVPARRTLKTLGVILVLALQGCGRDQSRAAVTYRGSAELPPASVSLVVDAAGDARTFRGAELPQQGTTVRTPEIETATAGDLHVSYALGTATGEVSRGSVTLDLRADWIWGIDIMIDSLNPVRQCFGCVGARSFPIPATYQRSPRDSVWMVWGGNSLSNPVIY